MQEAISRWVAGLGAGLLLGIAVGLLALVPATLHLLRRVRSKRVPDAYQD